MYKDDDLKNILYKLCDVIYYCIPDDKTFYGRQSVLVSLKEEIRDLEVSDNSTDTN